MGDLKTYLAQVKREFGTGEATEHTHRAALKGLVESFAPDVVAINEPKHVDCGAPDYVVKREGLSVGYIEAKDVGKSLDEAERSEQLERYLSLDNLILTDYLEFRWYHRGELRESARLARLTRDGKIVSEKKGEAEVVQLFSSFLDQTPIPVTSSKELSVKLARIALLIRDAVVKAFEREVASVHISSLRRNFSEVLIPDLDLPEKTAEFADMYSQTLVYGLFAARCNHQGPEPFRRLGAAREIPKTNPFLRQLFEIITGNALDDEPHVNYVDDVVSILDHTDLNSILADFGKKTKQEDPVVHFYETFLAAYDPQLRNSRGVYYTPEPVVSYIIRSVDSILETKFGLENGLMHTLSKTEYYEERVAKDQFIRGKTALEKLPERELKTSPKVLILDPACGTGTFLYSVIDHIRSKYMDRGDAGLWSAFVRDQLLPRIFGFELLMASYSVAHFKLGMQLAGQDLPEDIRKDWSYDFSGKERLGVFLTNTLDQGEGAWNIQFGGYDMIREEAEDAFIVKHNKPIMVVLGNPPYSGHSANRSWEMVDGKKNPTFIGDILQDYYRVDGRPLGERQPKWLQDDYVKFIRWGQWRIEQTWIDQTKAEQRTGIKQTKGGILAFITNHGYLDNPTFRGMRQQLMEAFSEIYVLDLHGNAKKKEACPDGSKDENVFDIQQGVAIGIFVKTPEKTSPTKVYHAELWGLRDNNGNKYGKYPWLLSHDIENTEWTELMPQSPFYLFIPQNTELLGEYELGWNIKDIFSDSNIGFVTARDRFAIDIDPDKLTQRISDFRNLYIPDQEFADAYGLKNTSSWNLSKSRQLIASNDEWKEDLMVCLYRPFDRRHIYYSNSLLERPVQQIMRHMLAGENFGLCTNRQVNGEFRHILCSKNIINDCTVSLATRERTYLFPLYLYPSPEENSSRQKPLSGADWPPGKDGRVPNLSPEFVADFAEKLGLEFVPDGRGDLEATFGPEDVFDYIYAVFHSPSYRERYAEFLKIDFPRVPLTSDSEKFRRLLKLGGELVGLHLLESPLLGQPITRYPVRGDDRVEKGYPKYFAPGEVGPGSKDGAVLETGRVYINKLQYFEGVPPEVWEFQVGGYKVCDKWLKDRRERQLSSFDDLTHYPKIIVALKETIRLMEEVDSAIGEWPLE